jgi:hypothetical protein
MRKVPLPGGRGPELMTEAELILYLRIPEVSKARNYSNVIENLKRFHGLPCIHISKQPLYPLEAIRQWVQEKITREQ